MRHGQQVYGTPLLHFVGFNRISLKVGETQTAYIFIPFSRLRRWDDTAKRYTIVAGTYRFAVCPASDQPILRTSVTVK